MEEPHGKPQYSRDAYEACNRVRVQEGIKGPLPPVGGEPGEADNPHYDTLEEEVRGLFGSDTLEEV